MALTHLVTGGSGFIGSHLTDSLLARGARVVALDDLSTGSLRNLDAAWRHPGFRFVPGSVLDAPLVEELVRECDVVVHLAAAVGVKLILEQSLRSLTTNIRGAETVFEAAHRHHRKVLLASTSEIYGKNGHGPLSETADRVLGSPTVTRWAYSTSKAVDEILAFAYHKELGTPTVVVRLFNTVGPRQSPAYGMVLPRFVRQAVAGEPLTVYGDGTQTRCFCHVADTVDALLRLLDEPEAEGQVFNVGSEEEISILDLARRVVEMAGGRSPIALVPYDEAYQSGFEDMLRRVPVTARIRSLTGWAPLRSLDDILAETIAEAAAEGARPAPIPC